jgi:DnaJ homolog subfamily C member 2
MVNGGVGDEEDDLGVGDEEETEELLNLDPKEWKVRQYNTEYDYDD